MKIALLSDIHGNLEAFRAALEACAGADAAYHLGDLVGYGANPNACVELAAERLAGGVTGNHDAVARGDADGEGFNPFARHAIEWTRARLTRENLIRLGGLPRRIELPDLLLVHGAPSRYDEYLTGLFDLRNELRRRSIPDGVRVVCHGHTHRSAILVGSPPEGLRDPEAREIPRTFGEPIPLPGDGVVFLNAGSVGQPRDGSPDGTLLLLDLEKRTATFVRFPYDVAKAQEKILAAGLPRILAERLSRGQ